MIENVSIVNDTRKVRCLIPKKFNNDPDKYIEYLISLKSKCNKNKPVVDKKRADNRIQADTKAGVILYQFEMPQTAFPDPALR